MVIFEISFRERKKNYKSRLILPEKAVIVGVINDKQMPHVMKHP